MGIVKNQYQLIMGVGYVYISYLGLKLKYFASFTSINDR